ncbi:MAG: sulfur carrier protein ThiS [Candidatus Mucispirillum faecigallinarum]|uniref:Sulfur carrier protein ThiS n=1 Tax=Candidatus Mucispirillum faecigallinarum TaxID=2838699 RepID=A0A9D2GSS6_9BACT|nr:sulfur carrier protein ThiS [Mucispirillum sp.]MDY5050204.1 sulfur carrier protein ThiS [Candidatus Mucispirillum faecigallinarum]HIZ88331.1 sulfur carrier protein ThiS [Candidatus Mucispirillum faecigallinarum]
MNVKINGENHTFNDNITLENIIKELNITINSIVAEVNGQVITKEKFSNTVIKDNDVIELIKFVGGG